MLHARNIDHRYTTYEKALALGKDFERRVKVSPHVFFICYLTHFTFFMKKVPIIETSLLICRANQ